MPTVDEELQAYQEELERQREEQRLKQRQTQNSPRNLAKSAAKSYVKEAGKKAAKRAVASAATSIAAAAAPYVLPVVAVVVLIGALVFFVLVSLTAICNQEGLSGSLLRVGSTVGSYVGVLPADVCEKLSGLQGVVGFIDRTTVSVPPVAGLTCPAAIKPPPRYDMQVKCIDCVDLKSLGIPVKTTNTNPYANRGLGDRLKRMISEKNNNTFQVTEAFCPVVNHASPNHYNGFSVDINLKPEYAGNAEILRQMILDAQAVGFVSILCEYPVNYLPGEDCRARSTTRGDHIHIEEPNAFNS
ncbi:MAG: hypothetical protein U1C57_00795 [Candidatus Doudnabacteria bacterium]|nr:hypothetical protein [bacterium]MDZ4243623.1 hypothetical protein [Candidatus Doudnabacteria bacterium]